MELYCGSPNLAIKLSVTQYQHEEITKKNFVLNWKLRSIRTFWRNGYLPSHLSCVSSKTSSARRWYVSERQAFLTGCWLLWQVGKGNAAWDRVRWGNNRKHNESAIAGRKSLGLWKKKPKQLYEPNGGKTSSCNTGLFDSCWHRLTSCVDVTLGM